MSFSKEVKEELGHQTGQARHCQIAEFAAVFSLNGRIRCTKGGRHYLEIHTENLTVAEKSYMLLRKTFVAEVDIRIRNHNLQGNILNYYLYIWDPDVVVQILKAIKVMDEAGMIRSSTKARHQMLTQNTCCKRAFLRGVFLVAGSVTDPGKAYHLEIAVASEAIAEQIQEMMDSFHLEAKIVERKRYYVVYLKEGAQIVDFLNVVSAHLALMEFENVRIVKEVRNSVNRQVNCETANIGKTVAAATRQIEDIKLIEETMGLRHLAKGLRQVAEARLDYPESSLQELGQMLNPPIGKSGVNHRLRKLGEIASQLRDGK